MSQNTLGSVDCPRRSSPPARRRGILKLQTPNRRTCGGRRRKQARRSCPCWTKCRPSRLLPAAARSSMRCVSICLSIYILSIYLSSTYLSIHLASYISIWVTTVYLSIHLSVYLSMSYLFIYLSTKCRPSRLLAAAARCTMRYVSVYLSFYPCLYLLCIYLSIYLSSVYLSS